MLKPLRAVRSTLAEALAFTVESFPPLEPLFVRVGRAASRRSRLASGLYWFSHEALTRRLRQTRHTHRAVRIQKTDVLLDVTDATGRYPYFYGTPYEPAVTDAILTALRPGDVFIDIGANIGYFSLLAAKTVGTTGRVIAFEPHEGARRQLQSLAERNDVDDRIEVVATAVAERPANVTLFTTDDFSAYSTLEPQLSPMREVAAFRPATVVAAIALDSWLATRPELARRVRCIKIDVEGAEGRVIRGMPQTLSRGDLTIVCETTAESEADVMLRQAGFTRRRIESGNLPYGNWLYVRV